MLKQLTILSTAILLSTATFCMAAETPDVEEEQLSSEMKSKETMIETKGKVLSDINKQIYNKSNDALMREYVRNSNAMKKIMGKETKEIDTKNKKALSEYMQDDIGLQKEIIKVDIPDRDKAKTRPSTADLLK